jgi:predicted PurR-regulated permease PerM
MTTADHWSRTMITIIAVIVVFAALYQASSLVAPVAGALFIIAIVWPLQRRLQAYLPKLIALAIVIGATIAVFVFFASLVSWGFGRIARALFAEANRFQDLYSQTAAWIEGYGIIVAGVWADHFNVSWLLRAMQGITARLNATVSFWLVVVVYVVLGLLEVDDVKRKLLALNDREAARITLRASTTIAEKFRHYMLIRTLMSAATGLMVWALATVSGLQLAKEWGVVAFSLNYIPFIGPFIATLFPTLFALAQFEHWQSALIVFACLNLIQFVIGSYIEPRVAGVALAISPFLVLLSVFFWTYLWGIFGAFIGVPISIAIVTLAEEHPSSRWLAVLLGAPPRDDPVQPAATHNTSPTV